MDKEQIEAIEPEAEDEELSEIEAEAFAVLTSKSIMAKRP